MADAYRLTPLQEGILFHSLQQHSGDLYIVQLSCKLSGLDVDRWKSAWAAASTNHMVLRTAFSWKNVERPVQVVVPRAEPEWTHIDARASVDDGFDLERFVRDDRRVGFHLDHAPLMRMALVQLAPDEHLFVWTYHHLILDGWSALLAISHVLDCYHHGQFPQIAAPPFKDYVRLTQVGSVAADRAYWARRFAEPPPVGSLRVSAVQPIAGSRREAGRTRVLPMPLSHALRELARAQRVTLAQVVHALWALLLHRYCSAREVVFGSVVSDRPPELPGAAEMVGMMIVTVPLVIKVDPEATLQHLLSEVASASNSAADHGRLPLTDIQRAAGIDAHGRLFDSILIFENLPAALAPALHDGLAVSAWRMHWHTSYPLSLMVAPRDVLKFELSFDPSRFHTATIDRLLAQLESLAAAMTSNPRTIGDLLRSVSSLQSARAVMHGPSMDRKEKSLVERILDNARADPHRPIVRWSVQDGHDMSFAELDRRSEELAAALASSGIRPGDVVAVHLSRSPSLVVAILAALRLDATFLALDTGLSAHRKEVLLERSGARIAISGAELSGPCPCISLTPIGLMGPGGVRPLAIPHGAPPVRGCAYLVSTSGSTGEPKLVGVGLPALENVLDSFAQTPGLRSEDCFLAITSVAFDIAILELLLPLAVGAQVVMASDAAARDPWELAGVIERFGPTVMQATPTTWRMLLASGWEGSARLRAWCGGEALSRDLADRILSACVELWNLYGPAETTIWTMTSRVQRDGQPIELGTPIHNVSCSILDPWLEPVPDEVPGVLHFSGKCLSEGYLGNTAATARVFLPHPQPASPHARMYCTGDEACISSSGAVLFLGRTDTQVKVRGVRIELGEVESVLARFEGVRRSAAALLNLGGHDEIVAYLVCDERVRDGELVDFLAARLPAVAVPRRFIRLASLPTTLGGKLDRKALPSPTEEAPGTLPVLSRSATREAVAQAWLSTLRVASVDAQPDFFAAGGHSLKAISLIAAINRACETNLPVSAVFDSPTFEALLREVDRELEGGNRRADDVPPEFDLAQPQPLSATQERLYYISKAAPESRPFQMAAAVRFDGSVDPGLLGSAFRMLQRRHSILRTSFVEIEGQPFQRICSEPVVEIEVVDLSSHCTEVNFEQAALARIEAETRQPVALGSQVAIRCIYLKESAQRGTLLLVIHHILVDEWSLNLLMDDFGRCVEALRAGFSAVGHPAGAAFAQVALYERRQLASGACDARIAYWVRKLDGAAPTTLPHRRRRPVASSFSGGHHSTTLTPGLLARMDAAAAGASVTRFATILGAICALLGLYTRETDICISTMDAARDVPWMAPVIGPLAQPLILRISLDPGDSFKALAQRVQRTYVTAHRHRAAPLQQVMKGLAPAGRNFTDPLFRVMVVMQNMPAPAPGFGSVTATPLAVDTGTAECDLLVEMFETAKGLQVRFTYDSDLYDPADIVMFAHRLDRLLEKASRNPRAVVSEITFDACAASALAADLQDPQPTIRHGQ